MTEKKKFKSYVKGFGRGFLLFALTEPENRPTKRTINIGIMGMSAEPLLGHLFGFQ